MGAGIKTGQLFGGVSTATYDGRDAAFAPQRYLATLLFALGLDTQDVEWGFPEAGSPLAELWA